MPRRYRKTKKALERIAMATVFAGIGAAFYYSGPENIDPYQTTHKSGVYKNTNYILWEQPGTWTSGFSLGDNTTNLTYEQERHALTNDGRFTTRREITYTGDAPHVREGQADSLLRALKQHHSPYTLENDYQHVLDEYISKLE